MAGRYVQLTGDTNLGTIYITCTVTGGNKNGIFVDKITEETTEETTEIPHIETVDYDFTRITFVQHNFGGTVKKLTIATSNFKINNSTISCEITVSR